MAGVDQQGMSWRKSSYSADANSACVEVAFQEWVGVRDSKNVEGSSLAFAADRWRVFLARVAH